MPHYFAADPAGSDNKSRQSGALHERMTALISALCGAHQTFGTASFGLDHHMRRAWPQTPGHKLDIVVCTTGTAHFIDALPQLAGLFRRHHSDADPLSLGFECHKLLQGARGRYDYYGFIEDDIVMLDPLFFKKRLLFDQAFGPDALLQPNRCEVAPGGPVQKLYVDYRLDPALTAAYQDIADRPRLELPFLGETIRFERTSYPSAGCFFLNEAQLARWVEGKAFLDGDVSYLSPLDSAVTLSVMKSFRIYKPVLDQAWFLEVMHASPRWIGDMARAAAIRS